MRAGSTKLKVNHTELGGLRFLVSECRSRSNLTGANESDL